MKSFSLFRMAFCLGLLLSVVVITACHPPQPPPTKTIDGITYVSLEEVKTMLSKKLLVEEVERVLGKNPYNRSQGTWGSFGYILPEKKWLCFQFIGPYVTEARYDKTEICGVLPKIYNFWFSEDPYKRIYYPVLEKESFKDMDSCLRRMRKLPKKTIIVWQHSDCTTFNDGERKALEPLTKLFRDFCKERGFIVAESMGG